MDQFGSRSLFELQLFRRTTAWPHKFFNSLNQGVWQRASIFPCESKFARLDFRVTASSFSLHQSRVSNCVVVLLYLCIHFTALKKVCLFLVFHQTESKPRFPLCMRTQQKMYRPGSAMMARQVDRFVRV